MKYVEVGRHLSVRVHQHAGECERYNEDVDCHHIERHEPGRVADLPLAHVLDDRDVELPRQQKCARKRKNCKRDPCGDRRHLLEGPQQIDLLRAPHEIADPAEHHPGHADADGKEGQQFDEALRRDREHEA
jgi:hypothetical protein